eukprot:6095707-Prymnesium_polylepis.1
MGTDAELTIAGVRAKTTCFVQVDLPALTLQWSQLVDHSLSLLRVERLSFGNKANTRRRSILQPLESLMGGARRSLSEPQQSGTNGRSSKQVE